MNCIAINSFSFFLCSFDNEPTFFFYPADERLWKSHLIGGYRTPNRITHANVISQFYGLADTRHANNE